MKQTGCQVVFVVAKTSLACCWAEPGDVQETVMAGVVAAVAVLEEHSWSCQLEVHSWAFRKAEVVLVTSVPEQNGS